MPSFLSIKKNSKAFLEENLLLAKKILYDPASCAGTLAGRSTALLFEKPSTRTRVAFELASFELGAHPCFLATQNLHQQAHESLEDTARVLGAEFSAIIYRGFSYKTLLTLHHYSETPVINALTNETHPSQALTDLFTIQQHFNDLNNLKLTFIGDCTNNVALSLTKICLLFGLQVTLCAPPSFLPTNNFLQQELDSFQSSSSLHLESNPEKAATGADIIYTDVWTSMGQDAERSKREQAFAAYQINKNVMKRTKNAIFLHCLPANREKEVSNEVIDSDYSLVWKQAKNKKIIAKTLLLTCVTKEKMLQY